MDSAAKEAAVEASSTTTTAATTIPKKPAGSTPSEDKPANCYCGKERTVGTVELLCATCSKWFHEPCIGVQLGKLIPFATNYVFVCKGCTPNGVETFRKCQATISQMCITALANLHHAAKAKDKPLLFAKDQELIPYMEQHWEAMTTMPRRVTQSWYTTVQKTLHKDIHTTFAFEESAERGQLYGLVSGDLLAIRPNYEAMAKGGTLKLNGDDGHGGAQAKTGTAGGAGGGGVGTNSGSTGNYFSTGGGRQNKRKPAAGAGGDGTGGAGGGGPAGKKGRPASDISTNVKLPAHGYPMEHPFNKDGYRYILAEPDPHAPFRQEFDESADWAGKPIPGWLYRTLSPSAVLLALHDRAPQLKIAEDRLSVTGEKGYCMVRASHFVMRGSWYFEATVEEMPEGSTARIGWGQEYANLQAPLGFDKFGYSWRSRKGTKFHESHGKSYSPGYGEGDTLGFLIVLPQTGSGSAAAQSQLEYLPNTFKDKPLVKFKSHLYYEDKDRVTEALKALRTVPQSRIVFFKNGVEQGDAFTDIYQGAYFPAFSIFKNATVSVNFGPSFKQADVEEKYKCRGMHERVENLICEQTLADMMYLTENGGMLRLDNL